MSADLVDRWRHSLVWWGDPEAFREIVFAVAALVAYLATAPRGRRWLARGPAALLPIAFLPIAMSAVFGGSADTVRIMHLVMRFFVLASLLQSLVLVVMVSGWERLAGPLPKIFLDVFRWIVVAVAMLVALSEAGVEAGQLFTGSAVFTAALGFALKDTLGNVFAGLAIHAEHPFEVGDWIQYDANPSHIGRVVEINWRATKVLTLDEAYVIIPNGQLAQASIRNFTKPDPWSRRSLFIVTPYDVSPQKVQEVILECLRGSFGVLEHPPASVVTNAFVERGVEHWVRFFTTDFDKRDRVDGMARDRIWYALARKGIEIPVATQAIRLTQLPSPPPPEPGIAMVERRVACLESLGLFNALGPEQVRRLAEDNSDTVYASGEQVIRQGDPGESMFVIVQGRVEVSARTEPGPSVTVAMLEAGDYFGEMSLMMGSPRNATVTAAVETRLLEIGKDSFRRILAAQPSLVEQLGSALRVRLIERAQAIAGAGQAMPETQDIFARIREFFAM